MLKIARYSQVYNCLCEWVLASKVTIVKTNNPLFKLRLGAVSHRGRTRSGNKWVKSIENKNCQESQLTSHWDNNHQQQILWGLIDDESSSGGAFLKPIKWSIRRRWNQHSAFGIHNTEDNNSPSSLMGWNNTFSLSSTETIPASDLSLSWSPLSPSLLSWTLSQSQHMDHQLWSTSSEDKQQHLQLSEDGLSKKVAPPLFTIKLFNQSFSIFRLI